MNDGIVLIPTYNESQTIAAVIGAVLRLDQTLDILVLDDNSPDGTAAIVADLVAAHPGRVFLMERPKKEGLGTAYIAGFRWCLARSYDYIFEMDADFSHPPAALLQLYQQCKEEGFDVSIGSRYIQGINVVNWPLSRILLSYSASLYVRFVTGMPLRDPTAGFVCYRRKVLESIDLNTINFVGYAFQIQMKYQAYLKKFRMVEIPIVFTDRVKGESKLTKNIISEAVFGVLKMKFNAILKRL
jgi:dolichol-phosphate mannosyltransferase